MNKRGEIATLTIIGIALGGLLLGSILPAINPFKNLFSSSNPLQKSAWTKQDEIITPTLLESKDGSKIALGNKVERHFDTGSQEITPKLTLGQRIGRFFGGLSFWAVAGILFAIFVLGVSPAAILGWSRHVLKGTLSRTVQAIREVDEDTFNKLKPKLERAHDRRDRKVIDKIKSGLN